MGAAILLDLANLLEGRSRPQDAERWGREMAAIDECARRHFPARRLARYAFSLKGLVESGVLEDLRSRGYQVVDCDPALTASMEARQMSRLDDYALLRQAKVLVQYGTRRLLVVSADRDHEAIHHDLAGLGVEMVFAQAEPIPAGRPPSIRRVHLAQFFSSAAPLVKEGRIEVRHPTGTFEVLLNPPIRVGRRSRTKGDPEIALDDFDSGKKYSRALLHIDRIGGALCVHRVPNSEGRVTTREIQRAGQTEELLPGNTLVVRAPGVCLHLREIDVELEIRP